MSRVRNCWDNAPVESFVSSLKAELLPEQPWPDARTASVAITVRRFLQSPTSPLGSQAPESVDFENELVAAA